MFFARKTRFLVAFFSLAFVHLSTSDNPLTIDSKLEDEGEDACAGGGGRRGLGCTQPGFDNWDMEVDRQELDDDGRAPGVTSHDKETNYYVNTTQWCEGIRPCPVHSGTPSTSHNTGEAPNAFKRGARWTSGQVSKDELTNDGVWAKYSYGRMDLTVGFLLFEACDQISKFIFEGSTDDKSWQELQLKSETTASGLQQFKVVHSSTDGPKSFKHYRLRITETKWSETGADSGTVAIGNLQLCLMDKFDDTNDNPYVASPPYISDVHAHAFASSRWGRYWHEKYAFQRPNLAWSSKYLYASRGTLQEPQFVGYSFPIPRIVRKIRIMGSYQGRYLKHHPREFSFQGSDDMQQWTTLFEAHVPPFRSIMRTEELEVPEDKIQPFKNYRIYVTKTGWSVTGRPGGYLIMRAIRFC